LPPASEGLIVWRHIERLLSGQNMPTIRIKRAHHLDNETVRKEIQELADKLSKDLSASN
jgi:hypothetical protein